MLHLDIVAGWYLIGAGLLCVVSWQKGKACSPCCSDEWSCTGWDRKRCVPSLPCFSPRQAASAKVQGESSPLCWMPLRVVRVCTQVNIQMSVLNKLQALTTLSIVRWRSAAASLLGLAEPALRAPGLSLAPHCWALCKVPFALSQSCKNGYIWFRIVLSGGWNASDFQRNLYLSCFLDEAE